VRAVILDRVVSVTPITGDMTAAVTNGVLAQWERAAF
jgi:hypothetical protein